MVKRFGSYLKDLRTSKGLSQAQLATNANEKGIKKNITQSLLVQYESGSVALPDVQVLNQVAKALGVSWGEFALRVALDVAENYKQSGEDFGDGDEKVFEIWNAVLKKDATGTVLKSMLGFIRDYEVRDIDSLAIWQKNFPDLKVFWVIAPNFVDNASTTVRNAVLENIGKNVHYYYFIKEGDADAGGAFFVLLNTLAFLGQQLEKPISRDQIAEFVHAVNIPKSVVGLIQTDIVIANPQSPEARGFRSIRANSVPVFGVPIDAAELSRLIGNYLSFFGNENVFPTPKNREN